MLRRNDPSAPRRGAPDAQTVKDLAEMCALSNTLGGETRYIDLKLPAIAPNFLYRSLLPAWTEANQSVPISNKIIVEFAANLLDQGDQSARASFSELASRKSRLAPKIRRARLIKTVIDSINGVPTDPDAPSILNALLTRRLGGGKTIRLYPTMEIVERLYANSFGWDILEPFMADKSVTDILVNSFDKVFIKRLSASRTTGLIEVGQGFESPEIFSDFVRRLTTDMGSPIGLENPLVDFVLADGARGNATIWPSSMDPSISIRRPQQQVIWTLEHYVEIDSMNADMADFLRDCTLAGANLIAYGEVGSGKTTLLSALIDAKPRSKRIVTAEDTYEILIDPDRHPNRVRLVVANAKDERVNMRALVRNALRMQPDVLVVGETRDATAYDLLQALSVGSQGSMSTIHANGPRSALDRLSSLVLQSSLGLSEASVRQMVVNAINILVYTRPLPNGRRVIWRIDEVVGFDAENRFDHRCVFRTTLKSRAGGAGDYDASFIKNPNYRMGRDLRVLFANTGLDTDRWSPPDEEEEEDLDFAPSVPAAKNVTSSALLDPEDGSRALDEAARPVKLSAAAKPTTNGAI